MRNLMNLARARGVDLRGVAIAVLLPTAVALLGVDVVLLAWHNLLPGLFALGGLPLVLCAASLLSSDVWQTNEERLDRWLGLSFRGEHRVACAKAYADLWSDEADV